MNGRGTEPHPLTALFDERDAAVERAEKAEASAAAMRTVLRQWRAFDRMSGDGPATMVMAARHALQRMIDIETDDDATPGATLLAELDRLRAQLDSAVDALERMCGRYVADGGEQSLPEYRAACSAIAKARGES